MEIIFKIVSRTTEPTNFRSCASRNRPWSVEEIPTLQQMAGNTQEDNFLSQNFFNKLFVFEYYIPMINVQAKNEVKTGEYWPSCSDFSETLDNSFALLCGSFFLVRFSGSCQFFDPLSKVPLVDEWRVRHSTIPCTHFLVLAVLRVVITDNMFVSRLASWTTSWSFRCLVFILYIFP